MLRYFDKEEFVMGKEIVFDKMDSDFLYMLDELRELAGIPMFITSSYRSPEYNAKVGGAKRSMHLKGRAVDISCRNSTDRAIIVFYALQLGMTCGINKSFVHIDNREGSRIFLY